MVERIACHFQLLVHVHRAKIQYLKPLNLKMIFWGGGGGSQKSKCFSYFKVVALYITAW